MKSIDETSQHITNTYIYSNNCDIRYNLNQDNIYVLTAVLASRGGIPYVETNNNNVFLSYRSANNPLIKNIVAYLDPSLIEPIPKTEVLLVGKRIDLVSLYRDIYLY